MVSLTPLPSYPKEKVPGAHSIRGWVGSTASVYCCRRDQSLAPAWLQTPERPARSLVITLSTLSRFLILSFSIIKLNILRCNFSFRGSTKSHSTPTALTVVQRLLHNVADIGKVSVRPKRFNSLKRRNT
jgi:hypothetical protein